MSRIELTDGAMDIVSKMSDGNPGAIMAMCELIKESAAIDPQCVWEGLGPLISLDSREIYGTDIYILFNDKCKRDVRKMCIMLRACQLGHISQAEIVRLSKDQKRAFEVTDEQWQSWDDFVCGKLEEFQKPELITEGE